MSSSNDDSRLPRPKLWKVLLSFLLVPYFFLILLSQAPHELKLRKMFYDPVRLYYMFFGVNQWWAMFAPDVPKMNSKATCIVTMADGTKEFLNTNQIDDQDHFLIVKWNKCITENSFGPQFHEFLPDLSRWIGNQVAVAPDYPLMLSYNQWTADIPPPSEPAAPRAKLPPETKFTTWFVYFY